MSQNPRITYREEFPFQPGLGALTRELNSERRQQQRLVAGIVDDDDDEDDVEFYWGLTTERTKSPGGQTLLVTFNRCEDGRPFARWWVISQQLVFDDETVYGIDNERDALAQVKSRL